MRTVSQQELNSFTKQVKDLATEEESPIDIRRVLQKAAEGLVSKRLENATTLESAKDKAVGILINKLTDKLSVRELLSAIKQLDEMSGVDIDRILGVGDKAPPARKPGESVSPGLSIFVQSPDIPSPGAPSSHGASPGTHATYRVIDAVLQASEALQAEYEEITDNEGLKSDSE